MAKVLRRLARITLAAVAALGLLVAVVFPAAGLVIVRNGLDYGQLMAEWMRLCFELAGQYGGRQRRAGDRAHPAIRTAMLPFFRPDST